MIEKFTFDIHMAATSGILRELKKGTNDYVASGEAKKKLILAKDDFELRDHVAMKLMAFMLFYDPGMQVEVDMGMHYKPDLVIAPPGEAIQLWVDCGKIAVKKVESLSVKLHHARFVIVKSTPAELNSFRKVIDKKVERSAKIEYLAFDKGFIPSVGQAFARTNQVTLYEAAEGILGLALNGEIFETALHR